MRNIKSIHVFFIFSGTFYRSATLYHPQRRAILHLKTQQRKLLERMPVAKITPFKDLKAVQNWSLQFALLAAFLSAIGLYSPMVNMVTMHAITLPTDFFSDLDIFFQIQHAFDEDKIRIGILLKFQVYLGGFWILGCLLYGFNVILKPRGCLITKLYLCISTMILLSLTCFVAPNVQGT